MKELSLERMSKLNGGQSATGSCGYIFAGAAVVLSGMGAVAAVTGIGIGAAIIFGAGAAYITYKCS